jgi:N-acetylneuraminate synthase
MSEFTAEFTTNHMGNFNVLMRMVERAADAGADYIKMQKKDVENFYTEEKLNSEYQSPYGHTYREYRTIFEFDRTDFDRFNEKCRELDMEWFATPQDVKSLHFLLEYDMPYVKVASTNSRNDELLEELRDKVPTDTGLVISIGGSALEDIEETLSHFPEHDIILQHCVSEYPVQPENLGLGNIPVLEEKFGSDRISIGYSGHENGIGPSLAAIDMGAELVERHFCLSRHSFVHHIEPSLETDEFDELTTVAAEEHDFELYYNDLPEAAFDTNFGMTDLEEKFLEENTYSDEFLGDSSEL